MDDERTSKDIVCFAPAEANPGHVHIDVGHAIAIGNQVVDISGVVGTVTGTAVWLPRRIEVPAGTAGISRTAVAFFVHMEPVHAIWCQATDVTANPHAIALRGEDESAADQAARSRRHDRHRLRDPGTRQRGRS